MHRNKIKKGHLILEVALYIGLVGILLIPVMNIGLFLFENYNKEKLELKNKINFIELNNTIEKYIEFPGTEACIEVSPIVGQRNLVIRELKSRKEVYRIDIDKSAGLTVKKYNENGGLTKLVTINHEIEQFILSENSNVLYIDYVFKNGYKDIGVYEK